MTKQDLKDAVSEALGETLGGSPVDQKTHIEHHVKLGIIFDALDKLGGNVAKFVVTAGFVGLALLVYYIFKFTGKL